MLFEAVTHIGSLYFYLAVLSLMFTSGRRRLAIGLSYLFMINTILVASLKLGFKTPRPLFHTEPTYSFPSGHTASISALTGFFLNKKTWPLLALPILVGVSRVVLNEHYLIDVIGGLALGLLAGYFLKRFFDARYLQYKRLEERYRTEGILLVSLFFTAALFLSSHYPEYSGHAGAVTGLMLGILLNKKEAQKFSMKRGAVALSGFLVLLLPFSFPPAIYLTHFFLGLWASFLAPLTADLIDNAS